MVTVDTSVPRGLRASRTKRPTAFRSTRRRPCPSTSKPCTAHSPILKTRARWSPQRQCSTLRSTTDLKYFRAKCGLAVTIATLRSDIYAKGDGKSADHCPALEIRRRKGAWRRLRIGMARLCHWSGSPEQLCGRPNRAGRSKPQPYARPPSADRAGSSTAFSRTSAPAASPDTAPRSQSRAPRKTRPP